VKTVTYANTVFVVDDDDAARLGLERLLVSDGHNVRAYASAEEYLHALDPGVPGCLILDLAMPGQSGLELQAHLAARQVEIPIVFLTGHGDVPASVRALKAGAVDFLEKPADAVALLQAVRTALQRDAELRAAREELRTLRERYERLSRRERQVFALVTDGRLNKQAAHELGITERTVKLHRAAVLTKMGANSLAELARMAERLAVADAPRGGPVTPESRP